MTFDATGSSTASGDPIVTCAFDVDGDGTTDATRDQCQYEHTYDAVGEYTASVTVTTESGSTATDTDVVVVAVNEAPTARIDADPVEPRNGETVVLAGGPSTDADGEIVDYLWRLDDAELTGQNVTYEFDRTGEVDVSLTVTDDDGAQATTNRTLTIRENRPPTARLSVRPATPIAGEQVVLDARNSTDPEAMIEVYRWDLDGDGVVDRETTSSRLETSAPEPGELTVGVTVVDDRGVSDTIRRTVAVDSQPTTVSGATQTHAPTATDDGTSVTGPSATGLTGIGVLDALDLGVVPFLPDWLFVVGVGVAAGLVLGLRRRETVRSKISEYRQRVHTGEFRRSLAKKGVGFVAKSIVKKLFRRVGDLVEFVTDAVGEAVERVGRAIKAGGKRVADFLRKLGN